MTDWEELDHVLTYVWNTPARPGSNIRRSQLDYGKTRAHEVVTAMLNEREQQVRAELAADAEHDG